MPSHLLPGFAERIAWPETVHPGLGLVVHAEAYA